jgi:hypothetical protein
VSVERVVKSIDSVRAEPALDEGARELCAQITAVPRNAGVARSFAPRRRWRLAVPLAAGLAAVCMASTWLLPGTFGLGPRPASAALDIRRQGGYYIVTVKDLFAAPVRYQAQLRGRGLNISLKVVPMTPGSEGRLFVWDQRMNGLTDAEVRLKKDLITTIGHPGPCARPEGCPIGLRIPVAFDGRASIYLGRKARPGENYQDPMELNAPGAPLHCVAYVRKTVDQVRALLRHHGVSDVTFTAGRRTQASVPGSWYVHDGVLSGPGRALLLVAPTLERPDVPGPVVTGDPWRAGC